MTMLKTDYNIMGSIEENLRQIATICRQNKLNFSIGYWQQQNRSSKIPNRPSKMAVDGGYWIRIFNGKTDEKLVDIKGKSILSSMLSEAIFEYRMVARIKNREAEQKEVEESTGTSVNQNNPYKVKEEKTSYTFFPFDKEGIEILQEFINITKRNMKRNS